ncbi:MAG: hypothetical protein K0Q87_3914 [Neobacillus sp.]|jgi:hypothetical protein|nr:hypothetical protein [Neobacillus sp.]
MLEASRSSLKHYKVKKYIKILDLELTPSDRLTFKE